MSTKDCAAVGGGEAPTDAPGDGPGKPEGPAQPVSSRASAIARWLPFVCLAAVVVVHFQFLMGRYAPALATPDANGYWAQGTLLFTEGRTWFKPESDAQYIGMHWLVTEDGRYYSRYPPGLSVLVGVVYRLFGYEASVLVNPVLASLSLIGLFLLLRRLLGAWWGVAGAAMLALNPVFNQHAIWCFAHMAVACCLVWGLCLLARWSERGRLWEVFLAGLIFGCIPTIRYPEGLFGLGVGVFLLWHWRDRTRPWLHALVALGGALLPVVPLLIRNHLAFGAFYRTGYALTNEQSAFTRAYFEDHFVQYIRGIHGDGLGLLFPLGVIGMTLMCFDRRWRRYGVLLALLAVPTLLLYMAYYWGGRGSTGGMRFLLPTFVCYVVAGFWLLARATEQRSAWVASSVVLTVLLLQLFWGGFHTLDESDRLRHQKQVYACVTRALEEHIQHNDVVIAHGQIREHLDFVRHWRLADLEPGGRRFRMSDPDAPSPRQAEKSAAQAGKYANLTPEERELAVALDIHGWAGDQNVYFVGAERELDALRGFFDREGFRIVARVPLPEPPTVPETTDRFGGRPASPDAKGGSGPGVDPREAFRRRMGGMGGPFPMGGGRMGGPMGGRMGGPMGGGVPTDVKEYVIAEWLARPFASERGRDDGTPVTEQHVRERARKLHQILDQLLATDQRPGYFWSPERERQLRGLLQEGQWVKANELLDAALKDYKRGPPR